MNQNKGMGYGMDADRFDALVQRFVESTFTDVSAQQEFIAMLLQAVTALLGSPATLYSVYTTDRDTNLRFFVSDLKPFRLHLESYFGVYYGEPLRLDSHCLLFADGFRVMLEQHQRSGSVLFLTMVRVGPQYVWQIDWGSDAYKEWFDNTEPDWRGYNNPQRTFDRVDPAPWHELPDGFLLG